MNRTRILVLILALVFSVAAAMLAKTYIGGKSKTRVVVQDKVEKTEILLVARKVNMGEKVVASALAWQPWPKKMVKPGMITRDAKPEAIEEFSGGRARAPLFKGEPLIAEKVVLAKNGGFLSALLPKGMRAIAVRVSVATGAGGFIMPNDRVDVLLTRKVPGSRDNRSVTDTVLTNVRVLAIDQVYTLNSGGEKVAEDNIKTATLELEPKQAEIVARTESMGQLTLALRSMADLGDSELGDDGPRLSPKYAGKGSDEVRILRYGISRTTAIND